MRYHLTEGDDLLPSFTDHRYRGPLCRTTILCELVCFVSIAESLQIRMTPPLAKHHQALHLCREFIRGRDNEAGIFIRKGRLICPHIACSRHDRTFDNLLHLA